MDDADKRGRKLLKQSGNVQMSQESFEAPRGHQSFRYFVGPTEGPAKSFDTPHAAWDHFQKLTSVPTKRDRDVTTPAL